MAELNESLEFYLRACDRYLDKFRHRDFNIHKIRKSEFKMFLSIFGSLLDYIKDLYTAEKGITKKGKFHPRKGD